jgi:site-specific DNA recombinase
MIKNKRPEAVILARVSSREQEAEGYSLPAQVRLLTEYCDRKGLKVKKEFQIAESASGKRQREVFDQMMEYINQHKVKHFVAEKVDRLTRNFKDAVMIDGWLEEDAERNVHLVKDSLIMHKHSRSQEKLNWGVRIIFAKNYIDNLKEEVEKGMQEKLAQGWLPGKPPLGYDTIGESGKKIHVINPDTARLVLFMFEQYDAGAYSIKSITSLMKEKGLRTRYGRPLVSSHITKMLKHPFYIGKIRWKEQIYPGKHEPIISEELFERVQHRLKYGRSPRRNTYNHLLRGLLTCEECDCLITWERQKGHWYGHCNGYRGCGKKQWKRQDQLDTELKAGFDVLLAPSQAVIEWTINALRTKHESDMNGHQDLAKKLQTRRSDLTRRYDIYYDDRIVGRITPEKYDQKVKDNDEEIADIDSKLAKLEQQYATNIERGLNLLEVSQHAAEIYDSKSDEEKRKLLTDIFSNLSLNGRTLSYTYTPVVQAIAEIAEEDRALHETFELTNNGSTEAKEALLAASRSIWLGR